MSLKTLLFRGVTEDLRKLLCHQEDHHGSVGEAAWVHILLFPKPKLKLRLMVPPALTNSITLPRKGE
ncbi:hypothetical protein SRHO_G00191580 [Serrasalmus rhombeus]